MGSPRSRPESGLRVLYVIDGLTRGGAETSLAARAPKLRERGVVLDVVTLNDRPGIQEAVRRSGASLTVLRGARRTWWRQVQTLVRQRQPDLVHTTLFEADLAGRIGARLARTPVVSTLASDAYGPAHRAELPGRRLKLLGAQIADAGTARLTTRLHAVSTHVADVMALRLRYPRERIDVIASGRDPATLGRRTPERRDRTRAALGVAPTTPLVVVLARHERPKALDVLLAALPGILRDVPTARIMVAGQPGNATPALEAQLARTAHAGAFTFLGARDDAADLLCAADLFVMPSRREGFGGAALEAMALECPAVLSDIAPFRELLDDTSARFVPVDDAPALAAAVVSALRDPEGSRRRADAAYTRFVDRLTIDAIADQMVDFYRRSIRGG